jgi:hypothetical protein
MKESNLFETVCAIFISIMLLPAYKEYAIDLLFSRFFHGHLVVHLTILFCLYKKKSDTWWILCFLSLGMVVGQWPPIDLMGYARDTSLFLQNRLSDYWGNTANNHHALSMMIENSCNVFQWLLLIWVILKCTRVKYQVESVFKPQLSSIQSPKDYLDSILISGFIPIIGLLLGFVNSKSDWTKAKSLIYAAGLGWLLYHVILLYLVGFFYPKF